jgi:hypothetical protein
METSDRRWIIAHANEMKMPADLARRMVEFTGSRKGLRMIRWWAENFETCGLGGELKSDLGAGFPKAAAYIPFGADAPLTDAKADMLELSTPVAFRHIDSLLAHMSVEIDPETGRETEMLVATSSVYLIRYANAQLEDRKQDKAAQMNAGIFAKHWAKTGWFRTQMNKKRPDNENGIYRGTRFVDADHDKKQLEGDMMILSPALARRLAAEEGGCIDIISPETGLFRLRKGFTFGKVKEQCEEIGKEIKSTVWREGTFWANLDVNLDE